MAAAAETCNSREEGAWVAALTQLEEACILETVLLAAGRLEAALLAEAWALARREVWALERREIWVGDILGKFCGEVTVAVYGHVEVGNRTPAAALGLPEACILVVVWAWDRLGKEVGIREEAYEMGEVLALGRRELLVVDRLEKFCGRAEVATCRRMEGCIPAEVLLWEGG